MVGFFVPPGGFAGFSQMTAASRQALNPGPMRSRSKKSSRKRKSAGARSAKSSRRRTGKKLKFGSPAFRKKYGAKAKRNAKRARKA